MNSIEKELSFGGVKSPEDYRKIKAEYLIGEALPTPDSFFVDVTKIPVWNQRSIGACTAFASVKDKQISEYLQTSQVLSFSPRFTYILSKANDGLPSSNQGTYYVMPLKMLKIYGVCTEKLLLNDTSLSYEKYKDLSLLTQEMYIEAANFKIPGYVDVSLDEESLKQGIMKFNGLDFGVNVGKEWWTDLNGKSSWNEKDVLPIRTPKEIITGHALYLYGWDTIDNRTRFWFMNSWSDKWGKNGSGYFFYDEYKPYIVEALGVAEVPDEWIKQLQNLPPSNSFSHMFNTNIMMYTKSDEVKNLQTALMIDGEFSGSLYSQLLSSNQLGYYGEITRKAVRDFQYKYNVANVFELMAVNGRYVGQKTRTQLNKLFVK